MSQSSKSCYCAFCKSARRVYGKKHLTWMNILLAGLTSILFMLILWQKFDARLLFLFVLSLIVTETFIQLRWRLSVPCPYCGFDALVYLKSPEAAAKKVRQFYELKKQESDFWIADSPFHRLMSPKKKVKQPKKIALYDSQRQTKPSAQAKLSHRL